MEILEVRSPHDLTATTALARQAVARKYQLNTRQFLNLKHLRESAHAPRTELLGIMTLNMDRIWFTSDEIDQVADAIKANRNPLLLDTARALVVAEPEPEPEAELELEPESELTEMPASVADEPVSTAEV